MVVIGALQGTDVTDGGNGDVVLLAVLGVVLLVGSLATQVATQAWEDTQAELESEDAAARLLQETTVTSSASLASKDANNRELEEEEDLDFIDLVPLPEPVIKGVKSSYKWLVEGKLGSVWNRLETVIKDEVSIVKAEMEQGVNVPGLKAVPEDNNDTVNTTIERKYDYPGLRAIQSYELTPLDDKSFLQYTAESVLFTFVLIKLFGGGLNGKK